MAEASRDGRAKKHTNKSCRDNNRQNAPYIFFSSNRVSMKNVWGCILSVIIPTTLEQDARLPNEAYIHVNLDTYVQTLNIIVKAVSA